ncbi:Uncharacterized protein Adt_11346 [Abeliophyllum distichum]|uniref:Uncharacterized protein n=1 Tax=Abeliophyllum distichum TaxID=126358 RepID=A0ABD1UMP5_9LAMI
MMSTLGVKLGCQIHELVDGCVRDINGTSSVVRNMEKELQEECTAQKATNVARIKTQEIMQNKMKIVGQQFNPTLQSSHHSIQRLCRQVPCFDLLPFKPLSIEDGAILWAKRTALMKTTILVRIRSISNLQGQ